MKQLLVGILVVTVLAACTTHPRLGPPAPIANASVGRPQAKPVEAPRPVDRPPPAATEPEEETVEVYAYRPPSAAPDAPVSEDGVPLESTPPPAVDTGTSGPSASGPGASAPTATAPAAPPRQVVAYAAPAPTTPKLSAAAGSLAKQAEQQRQMGDYVGAAATLERALRINSQEAYLWNRLARVRLEQGLHTQAGNLAARSNALAKDQASLKQDNWSIIAGSRRAAGDAGGAAVAEQKARGG